MESYSWSDTRCVSRLLICSSGWFDSNTRSQFAPLAQSAEAGDLKFPQYQFESGREYHFGSHALTGVCGGLLIRDSAGFDSLVILH